MPPAQLDETEFARLQAILGTFTARYWRDIELASSLELLRRGIEFRDTLNTLSALESLDRQSERLLASDRILLDEALALFDRPVDDDVPEDDASLLDKMEEMRKGLLERQGVFTRQHLRDMWIPLLGIALLVWGIIVGDLRAILLGGVAVAFCLVFVYEFFSMRATDRTLLETMDYVASRAEQGVEVESRKEEGADQGHAEK